MSQPPPPPTPLTPSFCFHPRLLRDFLRLSRSNIDDTISTHLNALLTPSTSSPFDPASTRTISRAPLGPSGSGRHPIAQARCEQFTYQVLFPAWQARSDVISYCTAVATSPDPDDPGAVARELEVHEAEKRIVDERLDPYSGRFFPREPRTERLGQLLRNEERVEGIVRGRTWAVVGERCEGADVGAGWEEKMERWRAEVKGKRREEL